MWQYMISLIVIIVNVELVSINSKYKEIQYQIDELIEINEELLSERKNIMNEMQYANNNTYEDQCKHDDTKDTYNNRRLIATLAIYFYLFAIVCVFMFGIQNSANTYKNSIPQ